MDTDTRSAFVDTSTITMTQPDRSTLTNETLAEILRLHQASDDIRDTYIWIVFILGFPGNIFSIITVLTMQIVTPATFFVAVLALCDGITLLIKLIYHQLGSHHVYLGLVGCRLAFLSNFLATLANWVLVFICAERFVSVCFPLKKPFIFTKRRSYISVALLTVVLLTLFVTLYCIMRAPLDTGCGTYNEYLHFWTTAWFWIADSLYLFIPFPCIVVLTSLIIRGLYRSRRERRSILSNGTDNHVNNRRHLAESERMERTITIMLILAAVIFLILALPACVFLLAYKESNDLLHEARWKLFEQVTFVFTDSSHAVNFFLYFFSAKRFRSHFLSILTCRKWRKVNGRNGRAYEITNTSCLTNRINEDVSCV